MRAYWSDRAGELARQIAGRGSRGYRIPLVRVEGPAQTAPVLLGKDRTPFYESFSEIVSLKSVDGQFLFRILKAKEGREARVFLTHAVPERYQFTFFTLEGIEGEFLTDIHGRAQLKDISIDVSKMKVSLCPASAVFRFSIRKGEQLQGISPAFEPDVEKGWRLDASYKGKPGTGILDVLATAAGRITPRRTVLIMEGRDVLISVPVKGVSLFENHRAAHEYQINVYE